MIAIWDQLRKFGLEYCDLPTMLSNVSILLRVLTVNIDMNYKKGIPFYFYIITAVAAACYFYVYLFSMAWFVFWRSTVTGDLVAAMIVLSLGISSEIGNLKLIYMCVHIEKLKKMTAEYMACDSQIIPGSRFHMNLLKALKNVKKRAILYWIVLIVNGIVYILKPIIIPGRNLIEEHYIVYGLEPMFESPNYEIAYVLMSIGVYFVCYVPASVTAYFIVITGYVESQMLALSDEILQIWPDALKKARQELSLEEIDLYQINNNIIINKYVASSLKFLIVRHSLIIDLFRQIEDVFRGAIAMGFGLLILALVAELLGKLENTYIQMPFALMQISMDCLTGQRVMDASILFEQAVYECQWENFDKTNMKTVQVMLQNSQKTMTLTAGGIAKLSFTSLMSILRGIYSTYTALRQTVK